MIINDPGNSKPLSILGKIKAVVGMTMDIIINSDGGVVGIARCEYPLIFLEESGGGGGVEKISI